MYSLWQRIFWTELWLRVHSLLMDMTASQCVTVILQNVITSTVVYRLWKVRSLLLNIPSVAYIIFKTCSLFLDIPGVACEIFENSDRCYDTQFYDKNFKFNGFEGKSIFLDSTYLYPKSYFIWSLVMIIETFLGKGGGVCERGENYSRFIKVMLSF